MVKLRQPHHYMRIVYKGVDIFIVYDHLNGIPKISDFIIGVNYDGHIIGEIFTPERTFVSKSEAKFLRMKDGIQGIIIVDNEMEFDVDYIINSDPRYLSQGIRYKKSDNERERLQRENISDAINVMLVKNENERLKNEIIIMREVVWRQARNLEAKDTMIERLLQELRER